MIPRQFNLLLSLSLALFFVQCKKETANLKEQSEVAYENISPENFKDQLRNLFAIKSLESPKKFEVIASIQSSTNLDEVKFENLGDDEHLAILSIGDGFVSEHNHGAINSLLVILDKVGNIRKCNIAQFLPENPEVTVLPDQFFDRYFSGEHDISGKVSFLNLADIKISETSFSSGIRLNDEGITNQATTTNCRAFYWVTTTHHYLDGIYLYSEENWEYLYTLCENTKKDHLDGGDTGGGFPVDPDEETPVVRQLDWEFARNQSNLWYCFATLRFRGMKKQSDVFGGHFTEFTFLGDAIVGYDCTWTRTGVTTHHTPPFATIDISGVARIGPIPVKIANYHIYKFNEVFP